MKRTKRVNVFDRRAMGLFVLVWSALGLLGRGAGLAGAQGGGDLDALPRKPIVRWMPSPHHDERPVAMDIDTLIIHDTETPGIQQASTIAKYFANPHSGVSAHFIVGKGGEIVQCVPEHRRAFHAGPSLFRGRTRVNDFSIGIELVNAETGEDPFTDAQYESIGALTRYLVARFEISTNRIVGHHDVTLRPHLKRDPAINFDWDRLLASAQSVNSSYTAPRLCQHREVFAGFPSYRQSR